MYPREVRLIDGPLVVRQECRTVIVQKMADDLIRFTSYQNESDAKRSLLATRKYSSFELVRYLDDARQLAAQGPIATAMSSR